jgi:hypothetical protein
MATGNSFRELKAIKDLSLQPWNTYEWAELHLHVFQDVAQATKATLTFTIIFICNT